MLKEVEKYFWILNDLRKWLCPYSLEVFLMLALYT